MTTLKVSNINPNLTYGSSITLQQPSYLTSPGAPIQTLYYRTDERTTWAAPVGDPSVATRVTPLGLTITPKKANSLIVMEWMINGEVNHDTTWVIHLNSSVINSSGYEGYNSSPAASGNWVGYVPSMYDVSDQSSTMAHQFIQYSIVANTTNTLTFYPAIKSSSGTAYTFYLNRTITSIGADVYENGISSGIIMEIAQ